MSAPESRPDAGKRMTDELVMCQKFVLMGRLCSGITHEVNNHLTGVSGYAQLLFGQERAQAVMKELDRIYVSATKCQKLIADLRRLTRFSDAKEFDNVNVVLKCSLDLVRHQFEKKSFQIIENYSEDIPPFEVDTPALEQLFLNIAQNSFEALQEKGGSLSVATFKENGQIIAMLEDDGPGLSEDALAHLYTPFFTTKAHLRCVGLGLAAAKMLVEAHGGNIEVDNRPGGGARVRVSFPCQPDE